MNSSTGTIVLAVIFVIAFSVYSFLGSDEPTVEIPIGNQAEIVIPISRLIGGSMEDEDSSVDEMEDTNESLAPSIPIPELESFDLSELEKESADIQVGLDFLENPF